MSKFKTDTPKLVEEEKKTNGHANGISENGANGHSEQDESSSNSPEEVVPKTKVAKKEEEADNEEENGEEDAEESSEKPEQEAGDNKADDGDEEDNEEEEKKEESEDAEEEEQEEKKEQPKPKAKPKKTVKIKEEPGTKSPKKSAPAKVAKPKAGAVKKPVKEHVDELKHFDVPPMSDDWVKENKLYYINKDKDMAKHVNSCIEPLAGATPEEMDEGYFEGAFPKSNISRMIKEVTTNVIAHYPERCPNLYESLKPTFDDKGDVTDVDEPIKISGDAFAALHAACEEYLTDMFARADKMRQAHGAQGLAVPHLRSAVYAAEFAKTRGVAFNFAVQKEGFIIKKKTKRRQLDLDAINKRRDELNKLGLKRFAEKYKSPELMKEEEIDKREEPTYWRKVKDDNEKLHYLERSENTQSDPTVRLNNLEEETDQDHTMIIGPGEEDHENASSGGNNTNIKLKKVKKDPEVKEEKKQAPKKKSAPLKEVKKEKKAPNKPSTASNNNNNNKQKSPQKRKASEIDQSEDERPKKKKK